MFIIVNSFGHIVRTVYILAIKRMMMIMMVIMVMFLMIIGKEDVLYDTLSY